MYDMQDHHRSAYHQRSTLIRAQIRDGTVNKVFLRKEPPEERDMVDISFEKWINFPLVCYHRYA